MGHNGNAIFGRALRLGERHRWELLGCQDRTRPCYSWTLTYARPEVEGGYCAEVLVVTGRTAAETLAHAEAAMRAAGR